MEKKLTKKEKWQGAHLMIPLFLLCMIDLESSSFVAVLFLFVWFVVASLPFVRKTLNENSKTEL